MDIHTKEDQDSFDAQFADLMDDDEGDQNAQAAPAPSGMRLRLPPPSAPEDSAPSFEDQFADLMDDDEGVEPTAASALTGLKRPFVQIPEKAPQRQGKAGGRGRPKGCKPAPGLKREPRFRLTEEDELTLEFLAYARYGTAHTVGFFLQKEPTTVKRRLKKLEERGYLFKRVGSGAGHLYSPTEYGLEQIALVARVEKEDFSLRAVAHTLTVANVLALLLSDQAHPSWSKHLTAQDLSGQKYPVVEHFLTEKELSREVNKKQRELNVKNDYADRAPWHWQCDQLWSRKRESLSKWHVGKPDSTNAKQEMDKPWTFIMLHREYELGDYGYHLPDLVLSYPREFTSHRAQAIAVEVELTAVNAQKLHGALIAYVKEFEPDVNGDFLQSYARVVWLCKDNKVAVAVAAAISECVPKHFYDRFKVAVLDSVALTGTARRDAEAQLSPEVKEARANNLSSQRFNRGLYKHERAALAEAKAARQAVGGGGESDEKEDYERNWSVRPPR